MADAASSSEDAALAARLVKIYEKLQEIDAFGRHPPSVGSWCAPLPFLPGLGMDQTPLSIVDRSSYASPGPRGFSRSAGHVAPWDVPIVTHSIRLLGRMSAARALARAWRPPPSMMSCMTHQAPP